MLMLYFIINIININNINNNQKIKINNIYINIYNVY